MARNTGRPSSMCRLNTAIMFSPPETDSDFSIHLLMCEGNITAGHTTKHEAIW